MRAHLRQYPQFALLMMIGALAMLVPAGYALKIGDGGTALVFAGSMALVLALAFILGLSLMNRSPRISARAHLVTILLVYAILPLFLALPVISLVPSFGPLRGYFEMLSSLTTTGASLIDDPYSVVPAIHLWRGLVSWMGGLFILVIAFSIMEPMNIGGFEIRSPVAGAGVGADSSGNADSAERILRTVGSIGPVYAGATFVLMMALILSGDRAFVAAIHAMSIMSTSGISPVGGLEGSTSGRWGEVFMMLFLMFAVSHRMFLSIANWRNFAWLRHDAEVRIMLIAIGSVSILLFLRHWLAAFDVRTQEDSLAAIRALWGSLFTVLSFLTTTGFESADWQTARNWSGMGTPGIVLLAVAVAGGGIATTAGGVKLLRLYALYKHGLREMERLVHPSSVGGAGMAARRFRREGGLIAWIFLMLFSIGIALVMLALALENIPFEDSAGLAIAALTNTGPAAAMLDPALQFSNLDSLGLSVLSIAMIFGRVEVLVLIALFNPSYWRR